AGTNESQPLTVTATSSNTALIPNPTVTYTSPNATGQLRYTPLANTNGTAIITVTVNDGQATSNTISRTFEVTVNAVNDLPTINPISDPAAILENAGEQSINFSSVSPGGGADEAGQTIVITATSNNTSLIPNPVVSYAGGSTGQLTYTPLTNQNGVAIITVTLNDGQPNNNITNIQFTVNVTSVNNPPTLDDVADPATIDEDAGEQTIALSGISAGGGENQVLTINVSSNNQQLISNGDIIIDYTSPATTGFIRYAPKADQFGSATITVSVHDGGDINNVVQKQFTVSVNPIADTPNATNATANGDNQTTDGLVILRSGVDGTEVNHMKITNIINGTLFLNDGTTAISDGEFISTAQGAKGLKFTPTPGIETDGLFDIQAATGNDDSFLGGEVITDTIFYNSFPESVGFSPILVNEDSLITPIDLYDIFNDPDDHDSLLTFVVTLNTNPELFDSAKITDHILDLALALNQNGSAELTIEATDPNGASVTDNLSITVLPINDAPVLETPPIELGTQGLLYEYNIVFNDPENETITIDTLSLPGWLTFENLGNGTARIFGTPVEEQVGVEHSISLFAADPNQDSTVVSFIVNIQNTNDLPYFTSIADSVIEVGDFYDYLITAEDPDKGDVLAFSIELLDGADIYFNYIDNGNGTATIFGTPPSGSIGYYNIVITVKDLALDSARQSYRLRVKKANNIPQLSTIGITINEDVPHNFSLNDFRSHFSDQDGDTIQNIKIAALPLKGTLSVNGEEISAGDTIAYANIDDIIYTPRENDSGIDIFQWNAFDGTDYALIPANVNINIIQINDPPEILDFDTSILLFEFGNTEGIQITEGTVFDGDG
ncbi:MAG: tandem-95 repeat protein, partial [Candidatus Marinimicrobia bacterium]|nr:tandem-95 repeat protein [Candidatus Neomarinimicrobiota bacterium]